MSTVITTSSFAFLFDEALAAEGAFALDELQMGLASSEAARLSKGLFGMHEAHGRMVQRRMRERVVRRPAFYASQLWIPRGIL